VLVCRQWCDAVHAPQLLQDIDVAVCGGAKQCLRQLRSLCLWLCTRASGCVEALSLTVEVERLLTNSLARQAEVRRQGRRAGGQGVGGQSGWGPAVALLPVIRQRGSRSWWQAALHGDVWWWEVGSGYGQSIQKAWSGALHGRFRPAQARTAPHCTALHLA